MADNSQKVGIEHPKELQEYLQDLYNWENEIKKKDAELRRMYKATVSEARPICSQKKNQSGKKASDKKSKLKFDSLIKESPNIKGKESSPQKLLKGVDYSSWDKFDVDRALHEVEPGQDTSRSTTESSEDDEMEAEQRKQRAVLEKDKGNRFFKEGKYDDAITCYTTGIHLDPENAMLPANRALALLRKGQFAAAEEDCSTAINCDPSYVKAYHRRGIVRVKMKKYEMAKEDFLKALKLDPSNKESKQELGNLEKMFTKVQKKASSQVKDLEKNKENQGNVKERMDIEIRKTNDYSQTSQKHLNVSDAVDVKNLEDWKGISGVRTSNLVEPILKPPHLRSQKPLRRMEVQEVDSSVTQGVVARSVGGFAASTVAPSQTWWNTENATLLAAAADKQPKERGVDKARCPLQPSSQTHKTSARIPKVPGIPPSSYQFMVDWRILRNFPEKQCEYLMQIHPDIISRIFNQCIDADIFSGMIDVISKHFLSHQHDAFPYLVAFTKFGRFSTLCMFLSTDDKKNLQSILNDLKDSGKYSEEELHELQEKFHL